MNDRIFNLNQTVDSSEDCKVVYWMSRDQRVYDNWALIHSIKLAKQRKSKFAVIFCLVKEFLNSEPRNFKFMLSGLKELSELLKNLNIPFILLEGKPEEEIPEFVKQNNVGILITDFDPLKIKREWKIEISSLIDIPFIEVDAHNIVPCRIASAKQEFGAYTFRPKINKLLLQFLTDFPQISKFDYNDAEFLDTRTDSNIFDKLLSNNKSVLFNWIVPGEAAAHFSLQSFINNKLDLYSENKNNPSMDGVSNLSPYLHFGNLSAQRVALEVSKALCKEDSKKSFLEELIVRRELSDNFCFYNNNYDNFDGFPSWAKDTLNKHRKDKREYIYSIEELNEAKTHDDLWNTAQKELLYTGKIHGYMRMYWAKKILEWSDTPEKAIENAIYLNDCYELDGRDANGYTGVAWSIGGVHDRAWAERNIFGKIRYMSYNRQIKKINLKAYKDKITNLS